jgi:cleavage and polyadenylation specificity factor subunit 6/7
MIGSDTSMRKILDQLSKKELHGNRVVATPATGPNLRRFEDAARKDNPNPQNGNNEGGGGGGGGDRRGDQGGRPDHHHGGGGGGGPPHNNKFGPGPGPRDGPGPGPSK